MKLSKSSISTRESEAFRWWERSLGIDANRLQLDGFPGTYTAEFAESGDISLWRYTEPKRIQTEFRIPDGFVEFCVYDASASAIWCGRELGCPHLLIHIGGVSHRAVVGAGATLRGIVVPESITELGLLEPTAKWTDEHERPLIALPLSPTDVELISSHMSRALTSRDKTEFGEESNRVLELIQRVLQADSTIQHTRVESRAALASQVVLLEQVVRVLDLRLTEAISIESIASEFGVSRRIIEKAFRRHLGVSPGKYLLFKRLELARAEILRGQSVLESCTLSGFGHPSRFAEMYRKRFGEKPSETKLASLSF